MRTAIKWAVVVVVVLHGLLHLLGAAKGLGWAEVSALTVPVGPALGAGWLIAGTLVVVAGVLLASGSRWFWVVGGVAVVASQTMILTSWRDAQAGTLVPTSSCSLPSSTVTPPEGRPVTPPSTGAVSRRSSRRCRMRRW